MNININKDFEKEYKDDSWRGFSMKETIHIGIAAAVIVFCGVWGYFYMGFPLSVTIYIGLPAAAPVLLLGFYRYQGMGIIELLKEMRYEWKIRHLVYEAGEYEVSEIPVTDCKERKQEKKILAARKKQYKKNLRRGKK